MHMKHVLIASNDTHTRAMIASALETLDVTILECPDSELSSLLRAEDVSLVVVDGARDPEPLVQILEAAVNEGLEARLLLVIEVQNPQLRA